MWRYLGCGVWRLDTEKEEGLCDNEKRKVSFRLHIWPSRSLCPQSSCSPKFLSHTNRQSPHTCVHLLALTMVRQRFSPDKCCQELQSEWKNKNKAAWHISALFPHCLIWKTSWDWGRDILPRGQPAFRQSPCAVVMACLGLLTRQLALL